MLVKSLIIQDFEIIHPNAGVNSIENILKEKKYIIVQDDQNQFYGILTPLDIFERPHKIVIDCLGKTERVDAEANFIEAYIKMINVDRYVLPVFQNDNFLGVISMQTIVEAISHEKETTESMLIQTERELMDEKEKSQIAEKLKEAFLQNISHELRTPLNGLLGFANILSSSQLNDYQKRGFYQLIFKSSRRFLDIMGEIIELSRIQSGDIKYQKNTCCSARDIINELYLYYTEEKEILDRSNIEIRINEKENDLIFFSDLSKIKQILGHIIQNGLKFTEKGYIEIDFKQDGGYIVFLIKDTGIGIPIEKQDFIFKAFEKLENNQVKFFPGVGVGLTIAKFLTNSLGGDIRFESAYENGSVFYISFPLLNN